MKLYISIIILLFLSAISNGQNNVNQLLIKYIKKGNAKQAYELIDKTKKLNELDSTGKGYLHYAVTSYQPEIVKYLINKGANIDLETSPNKRTPILQAIITNQPEIVKFLLDNGCNIKTKCPDGATPILASVQNDLYDLTKLLIEKGASINDVIPEWEYNALYIAVQNNNTQLVRLLLENGVNVNIYNHKNGLSPLQLAIHNKSWNIIRLIVYYDKDKKSLEYQNTIGTVLKGSVSEFALASNDSRIINIIDRKDLSVFDYLELALNVSFLEKINKNQKLLALKNEEGYPLIHKSIYCRNYELLSFLANKPECINAKDNYGQSALLYAAFLNDTQAIDILLKYKGDLNVADDNGHTPLYYAKKYQNQKLMDIFKYTREENVTNQIEISLRNIAPVSSFCLSNDNCYTLSGENSKLCLRDANTQHLIKSYEGHSGTINMVCFDDYQRAISCSEDGTIKQWDLETGQLIRTFTGHTRDVVAVYCLPDHLHLISASHDGKIIIWNKQTGEIVKKIEANDEWIRAFAIAGNGLYAATGSDDNLIKIWEINSGKLLQTLTGHKAHIYSLAFSPDNKYIFSGDDKGILYKWEIETGKNIGELRGHTDRINKIYFAENGKKIYTGSDDHSIGIWDYETNELNKTIKTNGLVKDLSINNDIITFISFPLIMQYDLSVDKLVYNKDLNRWKDPGIISIIKPIPNKRLFAIVSTDGLSIYSLDSCKINNYKSIMNIDNILPLSSCVLVDINNNNSHKIIKLSLPELNVDTITTINTGGNTNKLIFSNDGKFSICTIGDPQPDFSTAEYDRDMYLEIYDIEKRKSIKTLIPHKGCGFISDIAISDDNNSFAMTSSDSIISIWNLTNFKEKVLKGKMEMYDKLLFLSNDTVFADCLGKLELFDFKKNLTQQFVNSHSNMITSFAILPDKNNFITGSMDNTIKIWNIKNQNVDTTLIGHKGWISALSLVKGSNYFLSGSNDQTMKLWNWKENKEIATIVNLKKTDFSFDENSQLVEDNQNASLTVLKNGVYYGNKDLVKAVGFTYGLQYFNFDQFDIIFNRPDIVFKTIGLDTTYLNVFHKAYLKRMQKMELESLAINDSVFNVPEVSIKNRDCAGFITIKSSVELAIAASDKNDVLTNINIWINNVPLYGSRGKSINREQKISLNEIIPLSNGNNDIRISVRNSKGVESRSDYFTVQYNPQKTLRYKVYILGIGVAKYATLGELPNVDNDIRGLVALYKHNPMYEVVVDTFLNKRALKSNIMSVRNKLLKTNVDDIILLYYSGHGSVNSKENDNYFCAYDYNEANLKETTISLSEFDDLLDSIPSRNKLLLLNACQSGEIDDDPALLKIMSATFNDLRINNGTSIMSLSSSLESSYALTRDDEKNSVFGKAILDAYNNYSDANHMYEGLHTEELIQYISTKCRDSFKNRPLKEQKKNPLDYILRQKANNFTIWRKL